MHTDRGVSPHSRRCDSPPGKHAASEWPLSQEEAAGTTNHREGRGRKSQRRAWRVAGSPRIESPPSRTRKGAREAPSHRGQAIGHSPARFPTCPPWPSLVSAGDLVRAAAGAHQERQPSACSSSSSSSTAFAASPPVSPIAQSRQPGLTSAAAGGFRRGEAKESSGSQPALLFALDAPGGEEKEGGFPLPRSQPALSSKRGAFLLAAGADAAAWGCCSSSGFRASGREGRTTPRARKDTSRGNGGGQCALACGTRPATSDGRAAQSSTRLSLSRGVWAGARTSQPGVGRGRG